MLAKSVTSIPPDASSEPKWDGFRSTCDGGEVELDSRNKRPSTHYFPELVAAARAELPKRCVIDGKIVLPISANDWPPRVLSAPPSSGSRRHSDRHGIPTA